MRRTVVALVVTLAACGVKAPPRPPGAKEAERPPTAAPAAPAAPGNPARPGPCEAGPGAECPEP
jgi:predicted small lipoprotein YifL